MKTNKLLVMLLSLALVSPIYAKTSNKNEQQGIPSSFQGKWGRVDSVNSCDNFPITIKRSIIDQTVEWKKLKKTMSTTETTFIGVYAASAEEEGGGKPRAQNEVIRMTLINPTTLEIRGPHGIIDTYDKCPH